VGVAGTGVCANNEDDETGATAAATASDSRERGRIERSPEGAGG
jgi:hypothetical protein